MKMNPRCSIIVVLGTLAAFLTLAAEAKDITYMLKDDLSRECRGEKGRYAIIAETYENQKHTFYTLYSKRMTSGLMTSRHAKVIDDDNLIYMPPTATFADNEVRLESSEPAIEHASWDRVLRFCAGLDY